MLSYKGFSAAIEVDDDANLLCGRILGIRDVVYFEGKSLDEIKATFKEAVEGYLEDCRKIGKTPERPYSGKLILRMPSDLHAKLATAAERDRHSLNEHIIEALQRAV